MIRVMMILVIVTALTFLIFSSDASGGMECVKYKDCSMKQEHLCNTQSGLWTKHYINNGKNGSNEGESIQSLGIRN